MPVSVRTRQDTPWHGERLTLNKIYIGYYSIGMALAPRISYQNGCQDCIYSIDGEGVRREALHLFAV
jgi:hypothetical protein